MNIERASSTPRRRSVLDAVRALGSAGALPVPQLALERSSVIAHPQLRFGLGNVVGEALRNLINESRTGVGDTRCCVGCRSTSSRDRLALAGNARGGSSGISTAGSDHSSIGRHAPTNIG